MIVAFLMIVAGAAALSAQGTWRAVLERRLLALGPDLAPPRSRRSTATGNHFTRHAGRARLLAAAGGGAVVGLRLAGPPGAIVGIAGGIGALKMLDRRTSLRRLQLLERQLAELVDACGLAVRAGASVSQALEASAQEVDEPIASIVSKAVAEQQLGVSFDTALATLARSIGTEDARLFGLVMSIHHRSGGTITGPLEEVATTIRHRIAVRRELRALTAQGRISGSVLGVLPIAFFLVLSATSHRDLDPVYRSPAGAAMVLGGLVLDGLAYLWIRHLLRVDA